MKRSRILIWLMSLVAAASVVVAAIVAVQKNEIVQGERNISSTGQQIDARLLLPRSNAALTQFNSLLDQRFNSPMHQTLEVNLTAAERFALRETVMRSLIQSDSAVQQAYQQMTSAFRSEMGNVGLSLRENAPGELRIVNDSRAAASNLFAQSLSQVTALHPRFQIPAMVYPHVVCQTFCGEALSGSTMRLNLNYVINSSDLNGIRSLGLINHEGGHLRDQILAQNGQYTMGESYITRASSKGALGGYSDLLYLGEITSFSENFRVGMTTLHAGSPAEDILFERRVYNDIIHVSLSMTQQLRLHLANVGIASTNIIYPSGVPGVAVVFPFFNLEGDMARVTIRLPHVPTSARLDQIRQEVLNVFVPDVEAKALSVANQMQQASTILASRRVFNDYEAQARINNVKDSVTKFPSFSYTGQGFSSSYANVNTQIIGMNSSAPLSISEAPKTIPPVHMDTQPVPPQNLGKFFSSEVAENFRTPGAVKLTVADAAITLLNEVGKRMNDFTAAHRAGDIARQHQIISEINKTTALGMIASVAFIPGVKYGTMGTLYFVINQATRVELLSAARAAQFARLVPGIGQVVTGLAVAAIAIDFAMDLSRPEYRNQLINNWRQMRDNPSLAITMGVRGFTSQLIADCKFVTSCAVYTMGYLYMNHLMGHFFKDANLLQSTKGVNSNSTSVQNGITSFYSDVSGVGKAVPIPTPQWRTASVHLHHNSNVQGTTSIVDVYTGLTPDFYSRLLKDQRLGEYISIFNNKLNSANASAEMPVFKVSEILAAMGYSQPTSTPFTNTGSSLARGFNALESPSPDGGVQRYYLQMLNPAYTVINDPSLSVPDMLVFDLGIPQFYVRDNSSSFSSPSDTTNRSAFQWTPEQLAFFDPAARPVLDSTSQAALKVATDFIVRDIQQQVYEANRDEFFRAENMRMAFEAMAFRKPYVDPERERWKREVDNLSYNVRYRPALELISPELPGPVDSGPINTTNPFGSGTPSGTGAGVTPFADCPFDGKMIPHGKTVKAYSKMVVLSVCEGCDSFMEMRECNNGKLTGSYMNSTCYSGKVELIKRMMCE
jgi:hypothetical protein